MLGVRVFVCLALSCLAVSAHAQEGQERLSEADPGPEARARFQLGQALYQQGKFLEAAAEFERAHASSGHPAMLFNAFVCYRDAHELPRASERLRAYLDAGGVEGAEHTRLTRVLELLDQRVARDARRDARRGADSPAETPATPDSAQPSDDGGGASVAPWIFLVAGSAMLAGGAVTGILVLGQDSDLADRCTDGFCPDDPSDDVDSGKRLASITDVLLIGGGVAAAVGLIWLLTGGGDEGEVTATAACDGTGCGVGAAGRW